MQHILNVSLCYNGIWEILIKTDDPVAEETSRKEILTDHKLCLKLFVAIVVKNAKCLLSQMAASRFFAEIVSRAKEDQTREDRKIFHQDVLILTIEAQVKHHRHLLTKKNLQP